MFSLFCLKSIWLQRLKYFISSDVELNSAHGMFIYTRALNELVYWCFFIMEAYFTILGGRGSQKFLALKGLQHWKGWEPLDKISKWSGNVIKLYRFYNIQIRHRKLVTYCVSIKKSTFWKASLLANFNLISNKTTTSVWHFSIPRWTCNEST